MKNPTSSKLATTARYGLGLIFFVFGLNGFFHFLPQPPMGAGAVSFMTALLGSVYFFPLLKATEVVAGALLLTNRFVPLALTMLAPIIVNITAFHLFVAPGNYAVVGVILAAELVLAWTHRAAFAPMLRARPATERAPGAVTTGAAPRELQHAA